MYQNNQELQEKINKLKNNTPKELQEANNWVVWKLEPRVKEVIDGQAEYEKDDEGNIKYNKVPYNAITGRKASYTKKEECTSFKNAIDMLEFNLGYYNGVGFVFFEDDNFLFIDLDDKKEEMNTWRNSTPDNNIVTYFMTNTNSYTEISQSGEGLHIIATGRKPDNMDCKNMDVGLEVYDNSRFVAFTGDIFDNRKELKSIDSNTLNEMAKKYDLLQSSISTEEKRKIINDIKPLNLEFNEIQERLISMWQKRGREEELNHLLTIGYHDTFNNGDKSSQDMAILYDLAVITQGNAPLIRDFFLNATALNRDKLLESRGNTDYLGLSINNALDYYYEKKANYQNDKNTDSNNNKPYKKNDKFYSWSSRGLMEKILDSGELKPFKFVTFDNKRQNDWYRFINGVYVKQEENEARQIIKQFAEERRKEPTPLREDMTEDEKDKIIKAHNTYKRKLEEPQIRDNVEKLLKDEKDIIISSKKFDADDTLLNAPNCVIKLDDDGVEFLPHSQDMLFFKQLGTEYNTGGEPTKWLNFLKQAFKTDEELAYIQRVIGYTLTASTKEQCMFILLGNGRDGKGVFLNILLRLFGDYGKNAQATTFTGSPQHNSHSDDLKRLEGARLITINEADLEDSLNEQRIKQFTAGDYVTASAKYEKNIDFKPIGKIIMATNYLPHIKSQDDGIWRRIRVIPWDVPEITEESKNLDLEDELAEELPQIFNWALDGYLDYISHNKKTGSKLREPERFKAVKEEYRKDKDLIGQFLEKRTIIKENAFITIKELYSDYKYWAFDHDEYKYSKQTFNTILEKKGFEKVRRSNGWGFKGLSLIDNVNDKLDNLLKFKN